MRMECPNSTLIGIEIGAHLQYVLVVLQPHRQQSIYSTCSFILIGSIIVQARLKCHSVLNAFGLLVVYSTGYIHQGLIKKSCTLQIVAITVLAIR